MHTGYMFESDQDPYKDPRGSMLRQIIGKTA